MTIGTLAHTSPVANEEEARETKEYEYSALFLDEDSKQRLLDAFGSQIPAGWTICIDHFTLHHRADPPRGQEREFVIEHQGEDFQIQAVRLGKSEQAMAVGVQADIPYQNELPHITLAAAEGVNPYFSNKITNWQDLETPLMLTGTVKESFITKPISQV